LCFSHSFAFLLFHVFQTFELCDFDLGAKRRMCKVYSSCLDNGVRRKHLRISTLYTDNTYQTNATEDMQFKLHVYVENMQV